MLTPEDKYKRYSGINSLISKRGQYNADPLPEYDYLEAMEAALHRAANLRGRAVNQAGRNARIALQNQYQPPNRIKFNVTGGGGGRARGGNFTGKYAGGNPIFASPTQIQNAIKIASTGRKLGASRRDIVTALTTGLVESNLINLPHGDRDSVGIFQQRDPWGPTRVRMAPRRSAAMFFRGGRGGQQGLFDIANRNSRPIGVNAQDVQVSGYPDRYGQQVDLARDIMNYITRNSRFQRRRRRR